MQLESTESNTSSKVNSYHLSDKLIEETSLQAQKIAIHQARILQAINNQINTHIPVIGACTTNNGGILSWKLVNRVLSSTYQQRLRKFQKSSTKYWRENHLLTCIPAAGAASRFFSELQKYVMFIEQVIPELEDTVAYFYNKKTLSVTFEKRKHILSLLENLKIDPTISKLYDNILDQENENLKKQCVHFYSMLHCFLSTGKTNKENIKTNLKENVKKIYTSTEDTTRKPWEYYKQTIKNNFDKKNQTSHLMENFLPQPNFLKNDSSKNKEPTLFIGMNEESILKSYATCYILLQEYSDLPKALVPTTLEGDSFLMLKLIEQLALLPSLSNILVVPTNTKQKFESEIKELSHKLQNHVNDIFTLQNSPFAPKWIQNSNTNNGQWNVLEQGPELSTIRFCMDGTPFVDENGKYSSVSAGHGELIHLLDSIAHKHETAECLHFRNIDNIIGSSPDRFNELNVLAESFKNIRDCLEFLRAKTEDFLFEITPSSTHLRIQNKEMHSVLCYLGAFIDESIAKEGLALCFDAKANFIGVSFQTIHKIIGNLFHWQPLSKSLSPKQAWEDTLNNLEKPLSIFGTVRKEVGDVGGGPVFAELSDGTTVKLCMEMPHANEQDSKEYFGPRGKATHFNPVLVFFELRTHMRKFEKKPSIGKKVDFAKLFDERFWLLTQREYKGVPVCYHETILYELLGNSATTNLVFIEVPRTLFRPHKSYFDSVGNDRRFYGFDETLTTTETRNF